MAVQSSYLTPHGPLLGPRSRNAKALVCRFILAGVDLVQAAGKLANGQTAGLINDSWVYYYIGLN